MDCQIIENGGVTSPAGFIAGAVYAGVKSHKSYKPDVAVLFSEEPDTACAALFTTNRFCAAPVILGREIIKNQRARGAVINSGNANAGTGQEGLKAAREVEAYAEDLLGLKPGEMLVSSTGVIGEAFPTEKVKDAVRRIVPVLSKDGGTAAAWAIMTTDKRRKEYACTLKLKGGPVTVGCMAKGSGMIHPNMATTLCFLTTDAVMEAELMHGMLAKACEDSFHMLTVDGDTSTNDSLIMLANGASGVAVTDPEDVKDFEALLAMILGDMARRIAADGEGAKRLLTVEAAGLKTRQEARRIAMAVAGSSLVKAALGHGRLYEALILSAAGGAESRADFSKAKCRIEIGAEEAVIRLDFQDGAESAVAYGCDLTEEYVHLNGDYRS
ncbi:MAG: bifunctional ornithine acetyltransferase/N-acetylglutamate synthase [Lachnospiraceae bacterium]|nr:bifunctional ornithine acetyltransferase/N-acetylglutamate synthase [Lachnospiraceae bacterium]